MKKNEAGQPGKDSLERGVPQRPVYDTEQIEDLRKRLYSRGSDAASVVRHDLPPRSAVAEATVAPATPPAPVAVDDETPVSDTIEEMPRKQTRRKYRLFAVLGGAGLFILALGVSNLFMFWGGNTISGENISLTIEGDVAVSGGEEYEFQVTVANQNTVAIQSATLIVEYPRGTRSATDQSKEVSIERHTLDEIERDQMVNVPLSVHMYGEEQEQKEIRAWIEYRIAGSNATFEKHAEPLNLVITSSPVILSFDTVSSISSGKEVELDVVVTSNSDTPLNNLLLKVVYPPGFDFTEADSETSSGEDTWRLDTLMPDGTQVVTIRGVLTGYEDDVRRFGATVGVPNTEGGNTLASQLATADMDITIETSQLDLEVVIDGSPSETVVVSGKNPVNVEVSYTNTLNTALSDTRLTVELGGNALGDFEVDSDEYNASRKNIVWSSNDDLLPGQSLHHTFTLDPEGTMSRTAQVTLAVHVEGTRLGEGQVSQGLEGSLTRTVKIEGAPELTSMTNYGEGPFANTGPIPPEVGETTEYTYLLSAQAGANDLTSTEVTAILPPSVTWLDTVTGGDTVTFDPVTRLMKWMIGNLNAREEETVGIQVSFTPEEHHEGTVPTILETQRLKATDRFTGTTVRTEAPALTTSISNNVRDGRVED